MALQTFTAGQVLTAAQVTALQANDYNQTVNNYTDSRTLTIADLGDRVVMNKATATTITVNTGIFAAGDTLWIHNIGAGVCTITAGTATVSSSGSLALAQNAGGTLYFTSTGAAIFFPTVASSAQGLTLINTTAFSAVASQAVNSVFSSTYQNYRIVLNIASSTGDTNQVSMRLRVSTTDTSTNYKTLRIFSDGTTNATGVDPMGTDEFYIVDSDKDFNGFSGAIIELQSPNEARPTTIFVHQGGHNGIAYYEQLITGYQNSSTQFDGFNFINLVGNTTGVVRVYGYNN